jgi:hypothetical protein
MKSSVFWDVTPCNPVEASQSFGGTYRLHLQAEGVSQARNQLVHDDFMLGLLFDPEYGNDMFLEMSVDFQRTTWRYVPEDRTLRLSSVLKKQRNFKVIYEKMHLP